MISSLGVHGQSLYSTPVTRKHDSVLIVLRGLAIQPAGRGHQRRNVSKETLLDSFEVMEYRLQLYFKLIPLELPGFISS